MILSGWDFATVVAVNRINMVLKNRPLGTFRSSQGKLQAHGSLGVFQLEEPCDGGMRCSVRIGAGNALIQGGKSFDLQGLKIIFDLPLVEITPDSIPGGHHIALSFIHDGPGGGTGAGNLAVEDVQCILPPGDELKLAIATLVVNALRDNPQSEHIILARVLHGSVSGRYRPASWHFHIARSASGETVLVMLLSLTLKDSPILPHTLPSETLPVGMTVVTTVSRGVFWNQVMVPALNTGFGSKMSPSQGCSGTWKGNIKTLNDDIWLSDPAVTWGRDFTVDFTCNVQPLWLIKLLFRTHFKLVFDPARQSLSTEESGKPSALPQKDMVAALANWLEPSTFEADAQGLSKLLPVMSLGNFADLGAWFVEWPHLPAVKYTRAVLDNGQDPQFCAG